MKWTLISVAAGGALTYGLIFFVHAQREVPQGSALTDTTSVLAEAAAFGGERLATLEEPHVSNPAGDEPAEVETPAPARWAGDPWPAGIAAYQAGDYELAVEALAAAVSEKEEAPYRHYLLGLSYLKNGEPEGAVEELERAIELAPGDVRALVNLGRAQVAVDQPEAARKAIDTALDRDLDDVDAWNVLGRIELTEGRLPEAEAAFQKAVSLDAGHAYAWNNLGYVRILQERFEEAVKPLRNATESGLKVPYFFNNLGVALERTGDLVAATHAYATARDLGHPVAEVSLARVETVLLARGDSSVVVDPASEVPEDEMAVIAGDVEPPAEKVGGN